MTARGLTIAQKRSLQVSGRNLARDVTPYSGMFQDPIYQWTAPAINRPDGTSGINLPESLADLGDATAVGNPIYRADQTGFEAVEYDGSDDGHDWAADGQLPTGNDPVSVAATVYVKNTSSAGDILAYGAENTGEQLQLLLENDSTVRWNVWGNEVDARGGDFSLGEWITVGGSLDTNEGVVYLNGSSVDTDLSPGLINLQNTNHSIGYQRSGAMRYIDAYVFDVILCRGAESQQAFDDYHRDRLG